MSVVVSMLAVSCLATAVVLVFTAAMELRHALFLWRARRVPARDAATASGIVEIRGPARAHHPLMAPLTGETCVHFTVVLERKQPSAGQKRDGDPDLITFVGTSPFSVDDGTGKIEIDTRKARVPITGTRVQRKPLPRLTAPLDKMLTLRLARAAGLWCMGRDVIVTEAALLEGAAVSVIARQRNGVVQPVHVTTGRVRVVALQGAMRATAALAIAVVLVNVWNLLR